MTRNPTDAEAAIVPADITSAVTFDGVVNVRYRSAVIASSENAVRVDRADGQVMHFVPFRDVNFELLAEHGAKENGAVELSFWDVVAVGERVPRAVGVIENPPSGFRELRAHATFLSDELEIDIVPRAEKNQRVAEWPR